MLRLAPIAARGLGSGTRRHFGPARSPSGRLHAHSLPVASSAQLGPRVRWQPAGGKAALPSGRPRGASRQPRLPAWPAQGPWWVPGWSTRSKPCSAEEVALRLQEVGGRPFGPHHVEVAEPRRRGPGWRCRPARRPTPRRAGWHGFRAADLRNAAQTSGLTGIPRAPAPCRRASPSG